MRNKGNQKRINKLEMKIMKFVWHIIKDESAKKIKDISHREKAWINNYDSGKQLISYNYGFNLNENISL